MLKKHELATIIGESILFSSIQVSLGSVEMSSRFSVQNFSKDQETLQNAANALSAYLVIGIFWAVGTTLIMYSAHGKTGMIASISCNALILGWIWASYILAFQKAAKKNGLKEPKLFESII